MAKHFKEPEVETVSKKKKMSKGRRAFVIVRNLILIGILAVAGLIGYTAFKVGNISQDTLYSNIERSSIVYDKNEKEIDTLHYTEDRTLVRIDEMPDDLKNAFIAIEDKTFYKHHGFNFRRMGGAVLSKLLGKSSSISGTSTITQQLARNAYLAEIKSKRSISRKLSEMYIAWRLEKKLSKDEILEAYLNTIYLGYGNYGVGAAARTYFSKDVGELTLAESAALAALPQAPDAYALITNEGESAQEIKNINYYTLGSSNDEGEESREYTYFESEESEEEEGSGFYANDISKERRDLVLDLMAEQGFISGDEISDATVDIIDILKPSFEKSESPYTYFTDYLATVVTADLMEKYNMSEEEAVRMVYTGGLHIYTELNSDIQNIIYKEFQDDSNFPAAVDDSKVQAAMVVTEVGTGNISAMVGGRDSEGSKLFNRAVSPRQPGSSIKPLAVYGAALQRSYEYAAKNQTFPLTDYGFDNQGTKYWGDYITASSGVMDEPLKINGEEWPRNFSKTYSGKNSFRTALQQSINTCAVKIVWQVGLDYSIEMLKKYGLSTLVTDENGGTNDNNPAALALGAMTYGVTPLDMALAYATFPNGGVRNSAISYSRVEDGNGRTIMRAESEETEVLDKGVAWIMTDLLKSVVSRGIAGNAAISGIEVGGKTGTTNDTYDIWFDGFTPDYAAALWIGTDLNVEMLGTSAQAAALWSRIMRQVPNIKNDQYDEMPSNVIKQNGEYYTSGTEKNAGKFYGSSEKKQKKEDKKEEEEKPQENQPAEQPTTPVAPQPETTPEGGQGGGDQGGSTDPGAGPAPDPAPSPDPAPTPDPGGGTDPGTTPDPGSGSEATDSAGGEQGGGN